MSYGQVYIGSKDRHTCRYDLRSDACRRNVTDREVNIRVRFPRLSRPLPASKLVQVPVQVG